MQLKDTLHGPERYEHEHNGRFEVAVGVCYHGNQVNHNHVERIDHFHLKTHYYHYYMCLRGSNRTCDPVALWVVEGIFFIFSRNLFESFKNQRCFVLFFV